MALAALAVVLGLVAGGASASGDPPVNTVLPVVSGVAQVGQTLSASTGSWSGTAPIAYGYQWRRCGASYSGAVLGDGAQSYWRLGEASGAVAASETGSGGGSYQGGVTLGQPGALSGDGNTSVALDGATGAVSLPNPNLAGPFTIELWAFLKGSGSTGATGYATLAGYDWTHRLLWSTGNGLLLAQFDGNFFSTASASLNAWHQIVYSFDGSAEHFYIDGVPAGSHPTTLPRWQSPFYLGAYDLNNYLFNGRLDDTAVYNKALTPAQVAAHYGAGHSGGCATIVGATNSTYNPVGADVGATLQVTVAAQNSAGNASAQSVPTGTVAAATGTPPSNTALPTISGIAQVGQTLTATTGAWSGTAPITYSYQWRRCAGGSCADIGGATNQTYVAVSADLADTLRVAVTAQNTLGNAAVTSNDTATIQPTGSGGPVNTVLPVVSGVAQVGQTLSASTGSWSGTAPIAYGYQWRRCGASYSGAVLGDGAQSYWRLGEASGAVAASETGSGGGSYQGGVTLGQPGALSGDGNTSVALDGATGAVSLPNPNLAGPFTIELWAFLKGSGSTGATGYATLAGYDWTHRLLWSTGNGLLLAQFDGNFFSTASASLNAWHQIVYSFDGSAEHFYIDGVPAGSHPTTLPRWQSPFYLGAYDLNNYLFNGRLDDTAVYNKALTPAQVAAHYGAGHSGGCATIVGATNSTYNPVGADVGATLQVTVAAQNSAGNASAQSVPTGTVAAATGTPPSNTALPTISGIAQVGQTLTATTGAWSGTAPITYSYQWRRCAGGSCADIGGATNQTYVAVSADLADTLRVAVTAQNTLGNAAVTSNDTATIQPTGSGGPVNTVLPVVSGVAQVGQTLSASTGSWSGTAPIAYGYQWRRCGASYSGAVLGDGAQSYWRLGEASGAVAASETGSGGGSYQGGVTLGQPGALSGDGNTSVALDGATGAVSLPNPNLAGPFTIELWAFLKGSGSTGATGYATLAGYDWNHRILWQTNGGGDGGRLLAQFDGNFFSTSNATLNAWHQIVYSFDGSAEHFYIDGVPAGSHPTTLPRWQSPFYLGAYDLNNYLFNGRLDDTAVYNKALTPAQVVNGYETALATGCSPIAGATGATHLVVPADRGATVQVVVSATNSTGLTTVLSNATGATAAAPSPTNPITAENALPGTTSWQMPDATGTAIEGYTSQVSTLPGGPLAFHVSTAPAASYRIQIYRLGWYAGAGARLMTCLPSCSTDEPGSAKPVPPPDPTTGEVTAGWPVTDSLTVPSNWVSGYYVAKLVLTNGTQQGSAGSVYFVVKEPTTSHSAILVAAPVNTWEAYNGWGGKSLYNDEDTDTGGGSAAVKVSFDRPGIGQNAMMTWEYPAVQFFEREGYDVSYTTGYDLDADPASVLKHKLFVSVGHDEYWTKGMRNALQNAQAAGVNLAFLGGNTMYWQARYEDNGRTLVEYRDPALDPETDPTLVTTLWRELATPLPECELVGVQDLGGAIRGPNDPPRDYSVVSSSLGDPWLANTEFAPGATVADAVGYEWDGIQPGCDVPPETQFFHYGGSPGFGDVVRYGAASGAQVLAVGSVQFSWLLDGYGGHDNPPDPRVQQFIRNAFAAMTR